MRFTSLAVAGAELRLLVLFAAVLMTAVGAHNITNILEKYPDLSTFNNYLTLTKLAAVVNARQTITVCAVNNAAMDDLLSKRLTIGTIRNVLSQQIILDYFDDKKLHELDNGTTLSATFFQTTGVTSGDFGYVNITDVEGGKISFRPQYAGTSQESYFVKQLVKQGFNISVIQISKVLLSPDAEAPAPAPAQINITDVMSRQKCKEFASALAASSDAAKIFTDNLDSGLTVFCPLDTAFKAFLPKFNNLTKANQTSMLLFHGIPMYQSLASLKSNNAKLNTLATDRGRRFNFEVGNDGEVTTLKTAALPAKIQGTLADQPPVIIYSIDRVLQPSDLFEEELPAPTPAPEPSATKAKKRGHSTPLAPPSSDSPDISPVGGVADQTADNRASMDGQGWRFLIASCMGSVLSILLL